MENKASSKDCIQVAIRVRPLVPHEVEKGCRNIISKTPKTAQIIVNNKDGFTFNYAFAPEETQEMIYENSVKTMVDKLFLGYNVTILAYGQTGSGKTHTMGTSYDGTSTNITEEVGLIPRAINHIFDRVEGFLSTHTMEITCSFVELYQETLYDLLSVNGRQVVDIREDNTKQIFIANLTENTVTNTTEAFECLTKGSSGRAVGATAMNATSSRSHAIFTINVRMTCKVDRANATTSKFQLVDLAGSERSNKTKATGQRLKEGIMINQGLLALGNVISTLGSGQGGHIGYRDSKLTRLLQDSLGGNSATLMIACVSPADYNMEETLCTLRYADRARQIKNKPIVNMDPKSAEIKELKRVVQKLRMQLLSYENPDHPDVVNYVGSPLKVTSMRRSIVPQHDVAELSLLQNQLEKANVEILVLNRKLEKTIHDFSALNVKFYAAEASNEDLLDKLNELKGKMTHLNETFNQETCPAEFVLHGRAIAEMKDLIFSATDVAKQNQSELSYNPRSDSIAEFQGAGNDDDCNRGDEYRQQQLDFQKALDDIQEQIRLKIEVSEMVNGNSRQISQFESGFQDKIIDYETKIKSMENELQELKQSNVEEAKRKKTDKVSSKLAEERRKKLQQLEADIKSMQKKNHHQELMLKQQEQYKKQVSSVQAELAIMKKKKVELIKKINASNEEYRKWKATSNKQMVQLQEKNRKDNSEFRKEAVKSEKLRNVLKRKVDEALAANKRLKDALEKNRSAQNQRKKYGSSKGKADQINVWIDQEIEIIYTMVDAKHSLDLLMDDRAQMTLRLNELKRLKPKSAEHQQMEETLMEEIEMRNAQITDLQDKVKSSEIDEKIKLITDRLNSMPEARSALQYLFSCLTDLRIEFDNNLTKLRDVNTEHEECVDQHRQIEQQFNERIKHLEEKCQEMRDAKNLLERAYEEKVSMLLHELNGSGSSADGALKESHRIQEELLDALQQKISSYEAELKQLAGIRRARPHKFMNIKDEYEDENDYKHETSFEDDPTDPDWHITPAAKHQRNRTTRDGSRINRQSSLSNADKSVGENATFVARHFCNCKGDCKTKVCGCRKLSAFCDTECGCNHERCKNQGEHSDDSTKIDCDTTVSPNVRPPLESLDNQENQTISPKHKQSFEANTTTPLYPYEKKKRRPLLDL